jgi:hypothetical protein
MQNWDAPIKLILNVVDDTTIEGYRMSTGLRSAALFCYKAFKTF